MSENQGHSPLAQFEIHPLIDLKSGTLDLSFTNASLFMVLAVSSIIFFMLGATRSRSIVPGRWQCMAEMAYEFIAGLLRENVGNEGRKFFPLVFSAFMFILFCNLLGMLPYSFTATSHIAVTFALAAALFFIVTVVGFARHGLHFLSLFAPQGVPLWMMPLIIPIECISYLIRPVSLSIRLAANMIAGHVLLKVIAGFILPLGVFGILPGASLVLFIGFEIFIACLQAYIFSMLLCVYLNDAVNLH